ncbi:topoisomerase C-terminal repeat-containing protein [Peribacillus frigoritolerans]|uniref:topoisomerase C-terminal repeat-containing protein n=1 Tax=Peribacillus frigoritolerans TaxID=450367 RepID=UPI0021AAB9CE|nr:topoisomerase C-terminal repeat-containing protein [Peribacillus frigoritolerans]
MQVGVNNIPISNALKKVTEKHVKDLCTKKKTSVIKGMKPKAKQEKPFDASLVLKDDGSIGFEFAKKHLLNQNNKLKSLLQLIGILL